MDAILIISIFLIFVASFALLRTKRPPSNDAPEHLPPGISPAGLFGDPARFRLEDGSFDVGDTDIKDSRKLEKSLLERAARGELEALRDAHASKKSQLYQRVLDVLVGRAASDAKALCALVAFVTRDAELRSNTKLAELLLADWERIPTRAATAELLHFAALSEDAQTFERTLEAALRAWEEKRLNDLSAGELRSLFEGEYWLLSSEAQRSGAGFALKQKLANARRILSAGPRSETTPTAREVSDDLSAQKERP